MVVHTKKPNVITANRPLEEFSNAVNILIIAGDDCTNFFNGRMIRVIRRIMKGKTPLTPHAAITDNEVTKKSKQFMKLDKYANKPFATVSMKSAVYAAIWFALSLLGTAGLFFFQGAQFLAIATIVVYAGAIVVTFLFVIMLAQPDGQASYDRVSWAHSSKTASVITAALLVALLTVTVRQAKPESLPQKQPEAVLEAEHHVARLGSYLFSQRLVEIEVAGTLLLVALVGAVAILIHAKEDTTEDPNPEHG